MAKKKNTPISDPIDQAIARIVVDSEFSISKNNQDVDNVEFESLVSMLEMQRNEKDYDWMSDYYLPEMNSILYSEAADWANQYFQSRDFIECKLDGDRPGDEQKADAAKKCINNSLNNKKIYFYAKYIQLRTINMLSKKCYILARWERGYKTVKHTVPMRVKTGLDINGQSMTDPRIQVPAYRIEPQEVEMQRITRDHFDFDVLDPRNVFTDNTYSYSLQQKDWVTVRYEGNYEKLKANEDRQGYKNLDKVRSALDTLHSETDTAKESFNKDTGKQPIEDTPVKKFDVIDRYGKFWTKVTEVDPHEGYPTKGTPGVDPFGKPEEGAELIETIITFALIGSERIMIRFRPTPNIDGQGEPFKPLCRGLCYVHPTKDDGLGDGSNMRELQIAVSDTFNMSCDRTKLATLPTFIGRKGALDDNTTVYIEPEHVIEMENGKEDLTELTIRDNVSGAMNQLNILTSKMREVTGRTPAPLPSKSGTTATEIAGTNVKENSRANYKSLTFEYTFLQEFYWLILQMTYRFAHEVTAVKLMGDLAQHFDPNEDYTYTPVTSNIEAEYSKNKKISLYDQMIGRLSGLAKGIPEILPIITYMTEQQVKLLGGEYQDVAKMLDALRKAKWQEGAPGPEGQANMPGQATQNQHGLPISGMEASARENTYETHP